MKNFSLTIPCLILCSFLISGCTKQNPLYTYKEINPPEESNFKLPLHNEQLKAVEEYLDSLPVYQQIAQIFLLNIEGNTQYKAVEYVPSIFTEQKIPLIPGGALLFSYNIGENPQQIIKFNNSISDYSIENSCPPPYISVDQEGGYVNRLRDITSTLPSQFLAAQKLSPQDAYTLYNLQAKQMKLLGINMNLAPVCEPLTTSNSSFLQTRSFGSLEATKEYSVCEVKAFQNENIAAVLKHFPGNTNSDPHTGLAKINISFEQAYSDYIMPFKETIEANPKAILMSHAVVSFIPGNNSFYTSDEKLHDAITSLTTESSVPACLSYKWVTQLLREALNFKGLIISDDIFMGALAKNGYPPETACIKTIESGIDVIMLSEKKFGSAMEIIYKKQLEDLEFAQKLRQAELNVIKYKISAGILKLQLNQDGTYKVVLNDSKKSDEERLKEFNTVKNTGIEFYTSHF